MNLVSTYLYANKKIDSTPRMADQSLNSMNHINEVTHVRNEVTHVRGRLWLVVSCPILGSDATHWAGKLIAKRPHGDASLNCRQ